MFDLVQKNKTAVQVLLAMVSLGLVVGFGIEGYRAFNDDPNYLAKVGKTLIGERELAEVVGNRNVPEAMKPALVEQLVTRQLFLEDARNQRMQVSDELLRQVIATIPDFQVDGKFNAARYKEVLAGQQLSPEMFQEQMKRELLVRQLIGPYVQGAVVSSAVQAKVEAMLGERREVQVAFLPAQNYLKALTVSDEEIQQHYDANQADFKQPEMVRLEYVLMSQTALSTEVAVADAEVQKYYDDNKDKIGKPLAEVKPQIRDLLKMQKAQAQFREKVKELNELVYQKPESLKPAAETFKLEIQSSGWVSRKGAAERELSSPKVIEAVFSDDVLDKKHNSEAVEVAPGVAVVARVVEHKPEQVLPLAEVRGQVVDKLKQSLALKKAREDGQSKLKELQAGQAVNLAWSPARPLLRAEAQGLEDEQVKAIYRVAADKLPGYAGSEVKQGYLLFKVNKVLPAEAMPEEGKQQMAEMLGKIYGQVTTESYLNGLRKQTKVDYKLPAPKAAP